MKSWLLVGGLVVAAGAASSFFWQQNQTQTPLKLTDYVPADTVIYTGGQTDADLIGQFESLYNQPSFSQDLDELIAELDSAGDNTPLIRFAGAVLRDLFGTDSGLYGSYAQLGIDPTGPQQLYTDGIVPVLHLSTQTEGLFEQFWVKHAEQAGLPLTRETIKGQPAVRIRLTAVDQTLAIDLLIAERQGQAILSFVTPFDIEDELAQRVLVQTPVTTLAQSGKLEATRTAYGFTQDLSMFIDIEGITRAILTTQTSRLATDIAQLYALLDEPNPAADMTELCREEYSEIASWMPEFVSGYTAINKETPVSLTSRSVLKVKAGDVLTHLQGLNGHVPSHVGDLTQQAFGAGLAIDMDQLMPSVLQLWGAFNQYDFQCAELKKLQQTSAQTNPALMGVFTGMAQGVKGLGLSLYNIEFGSLARPIESVDLLLSIATSNPQLFLSMSALTPLGSINLPADGSATRVDLSQIQPGLEAKVALKGQHIALSTGPVSELWADKLANETLEKNGLFELAINYPRLTSIAEMVPISNLQPLIDDRETSLCLERARAVAAMKQIPLRMSYGSAFTEQGFVSDLKVVLDEGVSDLATFELAGLYRIEDQTWDCPNGIHSGFEEIKADGTGRYYQLSEGERCELFVYEYKWSRAGNRLAFDVHSSRARDTCEAEWQTYESYTASCLVLPTATGFSCIYEDDESDGLYAYRRLN